MENIEEKKICTRCGEEKALKEFNKNASTKDGLERFCKLCAIKIRMDYKKKPKEKAKRDYRAEYAKRGKNKENELLKVRHLPQLIKATPEEIIMALRKGIAQEILKDLGQEILEDLGAAFSNIREKWVK